MATYAANEGPRSVIGLELQAICKGLQVCKYMGFRDIQLATDSLSAVKYILKEWKPPWELANVLHDIWEALEELKTEVIHVFRETNRAADWLAAQKGPKGCTISIGPLNKDLYAITEADLTTVYSRAR
ncbi:hypothetical protein FRX31_024659 [Thalictrum thalictroides]|uniref:RNase H type-1 domain-containing protein n=1 Tax=Thalictrum thalictroides TaxID=46969 RepID=A0A7J6VKW7_THATH|nr:hypothetical protein FRX31_024659 [Thalictrum thalictroides]